MEICDKVAVYVNGAITKYIPNDMLINLLKVSEMENINLYIQYMEYGSDINNEVQKVTYNLLYHLNQDIKRLFLVYMDNKTYIPYMIIMNKELPKNGDNYKDQILIIPSCCILSTKDYSTNNYNGYYTKKAKNLYSNILTRYNVRNDDSLIVTNELDPKKNAIYYMVDKKIMTYTLFENRHGVLPRNSVGINRNLINDFVVDTFPIQHLFALFGINEKDFLKSLKQVTYLTNPITILGFGGTMGNFIFWCHEFKKYFKLNYIFKSLEIFEGDNLELSNIFRIPAKYPNKPVGCSYEYSKINIPYIESISLKQYIHYNKYNQHALKRNSIVIGTPDIETRNYLSNSQYDFICPMTRDDEFDIWENPIVDPQLTVETYGTINLNHYLLSMFYLSVKLIERLGMNKPYGVQTKYMSFTLDDIDFKENTNNSKVLKNITYVIT